MLENLFLMHQCYYFGENIAPTSVSLWIFEGIVKALLPTILHTLSDKNVLTFPLCQRRLVHLETTQRIHNTLVSNRVLPLTANEVLQHGLFALKNILSIFPLDLLYQFSCYFFNHLLKIYNYTNSEPGWGSSFSRSRSSLAIFLLDWFSLILKTDIMNLEHCNTNLNSIKKSSIPSSISFKSLLPKYINTDTNVIIIRYSTTLTTPRDSHFTKEKNKTSTTINKATINSTAKTKFFHKFLKSNNMYTITARVSIIYIRVK